ncbi:MAG: hypothetical protein PHC64_10205 [Candidatus Gastranaerophilales bacterium]|nr:hypothetical protein [Candidatus Gastranaerophilales bacterium]
MRLGISPINFNRSFREQSQLKTSDSNYFLCSKLTPSLNTDTISFQGTSPESTSLIEPVKKALMHYLTTYCYLDLDVDLTQLEDEGSLESEDRRNGDVLSITIGEDGNTLEGSFYTCNNLGEETFSFDINSMKCTGKRCNGTTDKEVKYGCNGNPLLVQEYFDDGSTVRSKHSYDSVGKPLDYRIYREDGTLKEAEVNFTPTAVGGVNINYDSNGKITHAAMYNSGGWIFSQHPQWDGLIVNIPRHERDGGEIQIKSTFNENEPVYSEEITYKDPNDNQRKKATYYMEEDGELHLFSIGSSGLEDLTDRDKEEAQKVFTLYSSLKAKVDECIAKVTEAEKTK